MRYAIGAAIGVALALLLGVPSFSLDRYTESEPPLFSTYCDLERTARERECVPSGIGIVSMGLFGAAVGALGAAAFRRRESTPDPTPRNQTAPSKRSEPHRHAGSSAQEKRSTPVGAFLEAQRRTDAVAQASAARIKTRDDIILETALTMSEAVEKNSERTGEQAILRKFATLYITDELRDHAIRLRIINLPDAAVERALEIGVLESQGTGPDEMLSRTSQPLRPASAPNESTSAAASDESTQEGSAESSSAASETGRAAPELFEELESLIRLHERGVLTDAELEAAKARLLSEDDG